ncbi:tRNA pseudouridine(55) synthase TruB [Methyloligella sp. 2.7D]|uniref:tRNA pseudouridine(55) synthase TruB n=1 Tax=unclassified Methyloligella TaxID=2625955 RepID=UPI00157DCD53|nr:tRNA pseudouridine(55) synthase TruB [Methyloligella sp. GL2]QKP78616.1 tRNA pseudouridine(55) synthase TruB [Methyloligella sp. GL2]
MARRRKGDPVHGWLILDKPSGITSTKAVGRLRHLFNAAKAGHAGTLDPLATGVLPIGFGEATKTMPFVVDGSKSYRFTVRFGAETATDDCEGEITQSSDTRPTRAEIEAALPRFTGEISQIPPRFSALKVDGARAYDLARDNEDFELAARTVTVDRLALIDMPDPDHAVIEADCGKGTYIRSIARDLARELGALGHVSALRRTRVGPFKETDAISLEKLEELGHSAADREALMGQLKPLETALDDIPALALSGQDAARLKRGQPVLIRGRDAPILNGPVYATSRGLLVAVGEVKQGEMRPTRVFNLPG